MKGKEINSLLCILMFLVLSCLHSQNPGYRLSQIYSNNNPIQLEGGYTYFYYYSDATSNLPDSMVYTYCSGHPYSFYTTEYIKDMNRQYIKESQFYSGHLVDTLPMYSTLAEYDTQGRICNKKSYMQYYGEMIHDGQRTFYIYDAAGNLDSLYWHDYFAINSCAYHINNIECDQLGRIQYEYIKFSWDSSDSTYWYPEVRYVTSYHNSDTSTGAQYINHLKESLGFSLFDEIYTKHFCYGKIEEIAYQSLVDSVWVTFLIESHVYDANNRIRSCIKQRLSPELLFLTKYEFQYDTTGNVSQITLRNWDNNIGDWGEVVDSTLYIWELYTVNEDNFITPISMSINTYPNPFKDNLNVTFQSKSKAPIETNIYNLKGQLVRALGTSKTNFLIWDGNDKEGRAVSTGIYFIKAVQNGQSITSKIIKMKN